MKKNWIIYNALFLVVLTFLIGIEYYNQVIIDTRSSNSTYVGIGFWLFSFHVLVFFPVWLIVLWFKRKSITLKAFLIGFGLLLLSVIPGVSCIVWLIGYMGGQT